MATERKIIAGTTLIWGKNLTPTEDKALTMNALAVDAARQGVKADLGLSRSKFWSIQMFLKAGGAPTAGGIYLLYWSGSQSSVPATGNDGGANGADVAYKAGEEKEWLAQLGNPIAALTCTNDGSLVQIGSGIFEPKLRYGMPVIWNGSDAALDSSDADHKIVLTEQIDTLITE